MRTFKEDLDDLLNQIETPLNLEVPEFNIDSEETDLTAALEAKSKVSNALDILQRAIDDFKVSVASPVDTIGNIELGNQIEEISIQTDKIKDLLAGNYESEAIETEEPELLIDIPAEENDMPPVDIEFDKEAAFDIKPTELPNDEEEESEEEFSNKELEDILNK